MIGMLHQLEIPNSLLRDIENKECIVFLGAGASTEGFSFYTGENLIDVLAEKCKYPKRSVHSLPKVAQYFCDTLDGGLKGRLLREIRGYIDSYMEYGELNNLVTEVNRLIAKIGFFRTIITTNWDVFMERELNVLPIVRDADLVYWDDSKRQVIKMHDCISQPETMVVTENDYNDFIQQRLDCPINNKIKDLMATKTFLFLGYSLRDSSFQIIHEGILKRMGRFSRSSYAVLKDPTAHDSASMRKRGIIVINSNAYRFLRDLHTIFVKKNVYFGDEFHNKVIKLYEVVSKAHFSTGQNDEVGFLSMMYQDGLQHSLQDLYYGIPNGNPKSHYRERLQLFLKKLRVQKRKGNKTEISYLTGRVKALEWALGEMGDLKIYCNLSSKPIDKNNFLYLRKTMKNKQE